MDRATALVVEKMAHRFEADGLPRIAGRILGYLLVSPAARSLDELAEALQASKASVSTNARLLERQGVVERVTRPGDRRDYYGIAEDLPSRMLGRMLDRMRETRDLLEVALLSPPAQAEAVSARLETFASFFGEMLDVITAAASRWEARAGADEPPRRVAGAGR